MSPPGGESINQVLSRLDQFVTRINSFSSGETIVVVGHGMSLRALLCLLLGLDTKSWWQFQLNHVSLSEVLITQRGASLSFLNDTSHLIGCEQAETSVSHQIAK